MASKRARGAALTALGTGLLAGSGTILGLQEQKRKREEGAGLRKIQEDVGKVQLRKGELEISAEKEKAAKLEQEAKDERTMREIIERNPKIRDEINRGVEDAIKQREQEKQQFQPTTGQPAFQPPMPGPALPPGQELPPPPVQRTAFEAVQEEAPGLQASPSPTVQAFLKTGREQEAAGVEREQEVADITGAQKLKKEEREEGQKFKAEQASQNRLFKLALKGQEGDELAKLRAKLELKEEFKKEGEERKGKEKQKDIIKGLDLVLTLAAQVKPGGRIVGGVVKGGAFAGLAPRARVMKDAAGLLAGQVAKKIGGESGRLTDQDRIFALNVMPKIDDTKDERTLKVAVLKAFQDPDITGEQMRDQLFDAMKKINVKILEEPEEELTAPESISGRKKSRFIIEEE